MDNDLFEVLLHQDESETLDFKQDQYVFEDGDDDQKSEILKDILAFANSWRRDDAYILIGVREVRGGRSEVCGTSSHILSRNLQQFVKSKVNKPITFSYSEMEYEGRKVGVITIPIQDRPFFLIKNYGRLKAKTIYVRRGDTTDVASPDEIYKMGSVLNRSESQPNLHISFGDLQRRSELGNELVLNCKQYNLPTRVSIPDYGRRLADPFGIDNLNFDTNYDLLRDIAEYAYHYGMFQPVGFVVSNPSTVAAIDVNIRFRVPSSVAEIHSKDEMPSLPSTGRMAKLGRRALSRTSEAIVSRHGDFYEARISLGTIQPGVNEWSKEDIFIGAQQPFVLALEITISADNLRFPQIQILKITSAVESEELLVQKLREIAMRTYASK